MPLPSVSAVLVTRNNLGYLPECFDSLFSQSLRPAEVIAVDNGSRDGSQAWLRINYPAVRIIENGENRGFSAANNQGIAASTGDFVLLVNTDVVLGHDFVFILARALEDDPGLGSASGKLWRLSSRERPEERIIDSAGEIAYRTRRMENRGEGELDRGQYDRREEVFGVTAAAALYRRSMLEDVRHGGDYFDSDYFAYLEDSDLNWRAQLRGWRSLYEPRATGFHARQHATRHPLAVRRHAFANRYLSLWKNETAANLLLALPHLAVYDSYLVLKALVREPRLLAGLAKVFRLAPRLLAKRRWVQRRRNVGSRHLRSWMQPERYLERLVSLLKTGRPTRRGASRSAALEKAPAP
jgi:GT2 family glycosyltransferase